MGAFCAYWTMVALRLEAPPFVLSHRGIALFAFAGAAGAVSAPIAGRLGDRGWTRAVTIAAHLTVLAATLLAGVAGSGWLGFAPERAPAIALGLLALSAVLLDFGCIADQALGRRAVNLLQSEARGRINGLFTGIFFIGGAAGSALAGIAWTHTGWSGACAVATGFVLGAVVLDLSGRAGVP
jgi:MFS family permease